MSSFPTENNIFLPAWAADSADREVERRVNALSETDPTLFPLHLTPSARAPYSGCSPRWEIQQPKEPMPREIPKAYEPQEIEERWAKSWFDEKLFRAENSGNG